MTHQPVLLQEAIDLLQVRPGSWYIDATLGTGGHTKEILKRGGNVLGIDRDPNQIKNAKLEIKSEKVIFELENFCNLKQIAHKHDLNRVSGILFDLGVSSDQLSNPKYGLSFQIDSSLDMRLSPDLGITAADIVNSVSDKQLIQLFKEYGNEPKAKKIADLIIKSRKIAPFQTTKQLALLAETAYGNGSGKIHPATRIFQALRIAVNNEFENFETGLNHAVDLLAPEGRLVAISFHSGEDRIVKRFLKNSNSNDLRKLSIVTKKPIVPSESEIKTNPRARSAKLRAGMKI